MVLKLVVVPVCCMPNEMNIFVVVVVIVFLVLKVAIERMEMHRCAEVAPANNQHWPVWPRQTEKKTV